MKIQRIVLLTIIILLPTIILNNEVEVFSPITITEPLVVVLDPGHGLSPSYVKPAVHRCIDDEPNIETYQGKEYYNPDCRCLLEIENTLDIAKRIKEHINSSGKNIVVLLTREKNTEYLTDSLRADFSNINEADVFLSIHFNAFARKDKICTHVTRNEKFSGLESFICNLESGNSKRDSAEYRENYNFFAELNRNISQAGDMNNRHEGRPLEKTVDWRSDTHFDVLRISKAKYKGIIEYIYQTEKGGREKISDPSWRQAVAKATANTILDFFKGDVKDRVSIKKVDPLDTKKLKELSGNS